MTLQPDAVYEVEVHDFVESHAIKATHALVPIHQWHNYQEAVRCAQWLFDLTDQDTPFDSRLKALRKALRGTE